MSQSEKPHVPPHKPHRSVGDTGTPQHGQTNNTDHDKDDVRDADHDKDDVRDADEEGDPRESHRSRGRITGENGEPVGEADVKDHEPSKDEHWESGRHKSD
jgi:hypothetical protein